MFFVPDFAFAAAVEKTITQEILEKVTVLMSITINILYPLTWVFIVFIGLFMDNEFILGGGIDVVLMDTWRMVRNLVNIGFVIVLLVIAIYNITGLNNFEQLEWKKAMKRFVLAVVLVNFSFFGGRVILDVANVFTTGVFAMPSDIIGSSFDQICNTPDVSKKGETTIIAGQKYEGAGYVKGPPKKGKCKLPTHMEIDLWAMVDGSQSGSVNWNNVIKIDEKNQTQADTKTFGSNNIAFILAENVLKLRQLPMVGMEAFDGKANINTTMMLFLKGGYGLIFMFIYGIGFALVAITLLGRAVYIWAFMCLSPIIAILSALEGVGGITSKVADFSIEKFVAYAFIPFKVALVTTMGFLLIFQFNKIISEPGSTLEGKAMQYGGNVQLVGKNNNSMNVTFRTAGVFSNFADIRQLAFNLVVVVVLWRGISWATKDTITSSVTDSIWNGVKGWGQQIAKAPLHAVAIPYYSPNASGGADEKSVSAAEAWNFVTNPNIAAPQLARKLGWDTDKGKAKGTTDTVAALSQAKNPQEFKKAIQDNQRDFNFLNDKDARESRIKMFKEMVSHYNLDTKLSPEELEKFNNYNGGVEGKDKDEYVRLLQLAMANGGKEAEDLRAMFGVQGLELQPDKMKAGIETYLKKSDAAFQKKQGQAAPTAKPNPHAEASKAQIGAAGKAIGGKFEQLVIEPVKNSTAVSKFDKASSDKFNKEVGDPSTGALKKTYDNLVSKGVKFSDESLQKLGEIAAKNPSMLIPIMKAIADMKANGTMVDTPEEKAAYEGARDVLAEDPDPTASYNLKGDAKNAVDAKKAASTQSAGTVPASTTSGVVPVAGAGGVVPPSGPPPAGNPAPVDENQRLLGIANDFIANPPLSTTDVKTVTTKRDALNAILADPNATDANKQTAQEELKKTIIDNGGTVPPPVPVTMKENLDGAPPEEMMASVDGEEKSEDKNAEAVAFKEDSDKEKSEKGDAVASDFIVKNDADVVVANASDVALPAGEEPIS